MEELDEPSVVSQEYEQVDVSTPSPSSSSSLWMVAFRFLLVISCLVCLVLLFAYFSVAFAPFRVRFSDSSDFESSFALYATGSLPNGLSWRCASWPSPLYSVPSFASNVRIAVGSVHEEEHLGQFGLAHFLEHMFFDSTRNLTGRNAVFEALEATGCKYNAFTSLRQTVYQVWDCPMTMLSRVLSLQASQLGSVLLDDESRVRVEAGAVLSEGRYRNVSSSNSVWRAFYQHHSPSWRPFRQWPIGWDTHVRSASASLLKSSYRKWYRADRVEIQIVGTFSSTADVEKAVEEAFGSVQLETSKGGSDDDEPNMGTMQASSSTVFVSPPLQGIDGVEMSMWTTSQYREKRSYAALLEDSRCQLFSNVFASLYQAALKSYGVSTLVPEASAGVVMREAVWSFNMTLTILSISVGATDDAAHIDNVRHRVAAAVLVLQQMSTFASSCPSNDLLALWKLQELASAPAAMSASDVANHFLDDVPTHPWSSYLARTRKLIGSSFVESTCADMAVKAANMLNNWRKALAGMNNIQDDRTTFGVWTQAGSTLTGQQVVDMVRSVLFSTGRSSSSVKVVDLDSSRVISKAICVAQAKLRKLLEMSTISSEYAKSTRVAEEANPAADGVSSNFTVSRFGVGTSVATKWDIPTTTSIHVRVAAQNPFGPKLCKFVRWATFSSFFNVPINGTTAIPVKVDASHPRLECIDNTRFTLGWTIGPTMNIKLAAQKLASFLLPQVDEHLLRDTYNQRKQLGLRTQMNSNFDDFSLVVQDDLLERLQYNATTSWFDPTWLLEWDARVVRNSLWSALDPSNLVLSVTGSSKAKGEMFLNELSRWLSYHLVPKDAPTLPLMHPSWVGQRRVACEVTQLGCFPGSDVNETACLHDKTEVVVAKVLPPNNINLFFLRRIMYLHMFKTIRSFGGFSYYAAPRVTINGAVIVHWQTGDYPERQDNIHLSLEEGVGALSGVISKEVWDSVMSGYLEWTKVIRRTPGYWEEYLIRAAMGNPFSDELPHDLGFLTADTSKAAISTLKAVAPASDQQLNGMYHCVRVMS